MVEFAEETSEGVQTAPPEKRRADYFAAVRERGMLNAGLDGLIKQFEADHPGLGAKWEYFNPTIQGGTDIVGHRESMGFRLVDASEISFGGGPTPSAQKDGPVRRGDMVMMCAPREIVNMIRLQDAQMANSDLKAPENAFKQNVEDRKVQLSDGTTDGAKPFGSIKQSVDQVFKTDTSKE